ncbi:histidine phosphatase family protein [Streptomyces cinnamoneus]|uniref:Histidine phosphatase family protein n=1 Tax=Streptomyces cinnamoneus TaxID=53446 RepID=A0A2G1XKK4_STRCJ|nr:histidine phosphatase family protein [Streptomyces cinnamoneus]PHQ51784.1 histidine phosphatase family protein [Streptomyces cinnamoneus]PPT12031.1 histidine phosphatase family protein [Streptomyces cinnamoneus]
MTLRVILISPASGSALREVRFDDDGPLEEAGLRGARAVAGTLPRASLVLTAPSTRCRLTASALGLDPRVAPELRDLDAGSWRGRTLDEVFAAEPEAVAAWLADPGAAPHGGESVTELVGRAGAWLDERSGDAGRVLAVAEPAVVRAVLVHALGLPPAAFWRLDVPPLTATELTGRAGRWNLRCGRPLTGAATPEEPTTGQP